MRRKRLSYSATPAIIHNICSDNRIHQRVQHKDEESLECIKYAEKQLHCEGELTNSEQTKRPRNSQEDAATKGYTCLAHRFFLFTLSGVNGRCSGEFDHRENEDDEVHEDDETDGHNDAEVEGIATDETTKVKYTKFSLDEVKKY